MVRILLDAWNITRKIEVVPHIRQDEMSYIKGLEFKVTVGISRALGNVILPLLFASGSDYRKLYRQ